MRQKGEQDADGCNGGGSGDDGFGGGGRELDDAHRLAISGRDTYWTCLAQEYNEDRNKQMSEQEFNRHIADVCPSERQSFRVALVDYLMQQFPNVDADAHMTSANNAIALAQKDVTTAFARHKAASK